MSRRPPFAALTPPSVADERGRGFGALVGAAAQTLDYRILLYERVDDAPAALLPWLVREMGLDDLVEPDLAERHVRALLKRAFALNAMRGYVAGIKEGLDLVGVRAEVVQWHQTTPKGPPGTHVVRVELTDRLFDGHALIDTRVQLAIRRIVEGMKRKSQDEALHFVARLAAPLGLSCAAAARARGRAALAPAARPAPRVAALAIAAAGATRGRLSARLSPRLRVQAQRALVAAAAARVRLAALLEIAHA